MHGPTWGRGGSAVSPCLFTASVGDPLAHALTELGRRCMKCTAKATASLSRTSYERNGPTATRRPTQFKELEKSRMPPYF